MSTQTYIALNFTMNNPVTKLVACNFYSFPDRGNGVHAVPVCENCFRVIETTQIYCPVRFCSGILILRSTNPYSPRGGYASKIRCIDNYMSLSDVPTCPFAEERTCYVCDNKKDQCQHESQESKQEQHQELLNEQQQEQQWERQHCP